jgi:hypothetical protein
MTSSGSATLQSLCDLPGARIRILMNEIHIKLNHRELLLPDRASRDPRSPTSNHMLGSRQRTGAMIITEKAGKRMCLLNFTAIKV